ncbi:MAG: DUF4136 domain-containing protein [Halioglobus sp.]|nr:DUF4136 domain-containing protein [Halioglobus sp.]
MRITNLLAYGILSLTLLGCSGVEIQPADTNRFIAGNYLYYQWRTDALPSDVRSSDPAYAIDPVMRRDVNADLQSKGYVLNPERAQFTVGYILMNGMVQGATSDLASNISPYPRVTPNRQIDQASVDNAIALGGVKETNNIILQFNDKTSNQEVWHVTLTKIVEDANSVDTSRINDNLTQYLKRALKSLPQAPRS